MKAESGIVVAASEWMRAGFGRSRPTTTSCWRAGGRSRSSGTMTSSRSGAHLIGWQRIPNLTTCASPSGRRQRVSGRWSSSGSADHDQFAARPICRYALVVLRQRAGLRGERRRVLCAGWSLRSPMPQRRQRAPSAGTPRATTFTGRPTRSATGGPIAQLAVGTRATPACVGDRGRSSHVDRAASRRRICRDVFAELLAGSVRVRPLRRRI